jgi:NitT/TauT family transport system ATP-binding protein
MIEIKNISKTFATRDGLAESDVLALDNVSLEIQDHQFVTIIGPSGCGKSTILNMIGALVTPTAGTITIDGQVVSGRDLDMGAPHRRTPKPPLNMGAPHHRTPKPPSNVGYVFQKDTVFPWRTVRRNIALGLEYRGVAAAECERRVREAIALAGLEGFEDAFPATLSGGMRQRVALMRSLIVDPEILLMDEPFGALDTHTKLNLHAELLRLWAAKRQTVVFVTHDLSEAITLADRIVVMTRRPGRIKQVYDVKLDRPRDVIKLRESPEYLREYGEIWHALGEEMQERAP